MHFNSDRILRKKSQKDSTSLGKNLKKLTRKVLEKKTIKNNLTMRGSFEKNPNPKIRGLKKNQSLIIQV